MQPSANSHSSALFSRWREFEKTKLYDFLAATPMMGWYALSIANLAPLFAHEFAQASNASFELRAVISLLSRAAVIVFIGLALVLLAVRRTPKAKAKGIVPRISAFAGTFLVLVIVWLPQQPIGLALSLLSLVLILGGLCFSIFALVHLGRSFSLMPEARHLVTNGPYAFVRHPLYLGEAISAIGMTLQYLSPLAIFIIALQLGLQLQRMRNEEEVLGSLFPEYADYRLHTARLVPGIY